MEKIRLGKTDLWVSRTAFGALPIQRVDLEMAKKILRQAYDGGITFFDSARDIRTAKKNLVTHCLMYAKILSYRPKAPVLKIKHRC